MRSGPLPPELGHTEGETSGPQEPAPRASRSGGCTAEICCSLPPARGSSQLSYRRGPREGSLPVRLAEPCADEKGSGPFVSPLPPPGRGCRIAGWGWKQKAAWLACRWRAPIHPSPAPSLKAADTVGLHSKNGGNYNIWSQAPGRVASKLSLVSKAQLKMKSQINRNRNPGKALGGWFSLKVSRYWKVPALYFPVCPGVSYCHQSHHVTCC